MAALHCPPRPKQPERTPNHQRRRRIHRRKHHRRHNRTLLLFRHFRRPRRLHLPRHKHFGLDGWLQNVENRNIGWFTANLDTAANFIPARLTAYLMVASAALLGENWRESWRILQRDKGKTSSVNAGWTISAMAGALNTQLEKQGCYTLGDDHGITPEHIDRALRVMTVTAVMFGAIVVLPILALRIYLVEL